MGDEIDHDPLDVASIAAAAMMTSARGFAVIDHDFCIQACNAQMDELFEESALSQSLLEVFRGQEDIVRECYERPPPRKLERLTIYPTGSVEEKIVTVEFGEVEAKGQTHRIVIIADVTGFVRQDHGALDEANFGIVRLDTQSPPLVSYINDRGATILGRSREDLQGKRLDVANVFSSDAEIEEFRLQRDLREAGKSTQFQISVRKPGSSADIPLDVYAIPEFDITGTTYTGTTAFFQSKLKQNVRRNIHELAEKTDSPHRIATSAINEIAKLVPHDFATIEFYYEGWARLIHLEPRPVPLWSDLWFPLSNRVRAFMRSEPDKLAPDDKPLGGAINNDFKSIFEPASGFQVLAHDKIMHRLRDEGYNCFLTLPVRDEAKNWKVSLTLWRRDQNNPFTWKDLRVLRDDIGTTTFLQSFTQAYKRGAEKLKYKLQSEIRGANSLDEAISELPDFLADQFQLQHASYCWCNYRDRIFELHHQNDPAPSRVLLKEGFTQPFDANGHLSLCLKRREPVVVMDLDDGSPDAKEFVYNDDKGETSSTMSLPIVLGGFLTGHRQERGRVVGVLHLQSRSRFAFPKPIQEEIQEYLNIIKDTLYGLQRDGIIQTLQREMPSGLILCDEFGVVWAINETALQMLGVPFENDWKPDTIEQVFFSDADVRLARQPLNIKKERVTLRHTSGSPISVLIDTADLPWHGDRKRRGPGMRLVQTGLRLIQMTDLNTLNWLHNIESVKAAVTGVTADMKHNLVDAHRMIGKIRKKLQTDDVQSNVGAIIEKLTSTLQNSEITADKVFNRLSTEDLAPSEADAAQITNIVAVVQQSLEHVKQSSGYTLSGTFQAEEPQINVSMGQRELSILFDNVLDYLATRKSTHGRVSVRVAANERNAQVRFAARLGEQSLSSTNSMLRAFKLGLQFVQLNEDKLKKTLEAHGGSLSHRLISRKGNQTEFLITVPRIVNGGQHGI